MSTECDELHHYASPRPRFAIRTIRNGRVRIFGRIFYAGADYDGRLDGERWAFGRYPKYVNAVFLWGSERAYREGPEVDWDTRPDVIDGFFTWAWWHGE